jgi:hypothetical protein
MPPMPTAPPHCTGVSYRDDLDSVNLLIAAGANVNAANDLGATPLWIACRTQAPRSSAHCCEPARIRTWRYWPVKRR